MSFELPWYFLFFCLLAGVVYAALLYWLQWGRLTKPAILFSKPVRLVLSALRFLVVSLIALLLLAPLTKRNVHEEEKPIIVVAEDHSQSVLLCKDSSFYRSEYASNMEQLIHKLAKDYDVQQAPYGDYTTDISAALSSIADQYEGRNVAAVLLTGDGIYNQGGNPTTMASRLKYPVYSVALGDTSVRRDAAVSQVSYNNIAYLGNQFPLEITVRASQLLGEQKLLTVSHNGRTLFSKMLTYDATFFSHTEQVLLKADQVGVQSYTITIAPAMDEVSVKNNSRTVVVEIIDGRQKIAIVAAAPHPDVAAIKQSIELNQNYEVESFLAKDFVFKPHTYDLLILHNLPAKHQPWNLDAALATPTIFVLGSQTDLARFNALRTGLEITTQLDKQVEVSSVGNSHFTLFTLDDETRQQLEQMPPLYAPFGNYKLSANAQSLFTAKIGTITSNQPLVAFAQQQEVRRCFVVGEGLWKWRMAEFQMHQHHESFNGIIGKMVLYTSLRINKQRFHVTCDKFFSQGSAVSLSAELYNDNYEPINDPEAEITLGSSTYKFNRQGSGYNLNLGVLDPGEYDYLAKTFYNGKQFTVTGSFVVEEVNLEELQLVADHSLLNTLSQMTGGQMLYPDQLEDFPQLLEQRDDVMPVIYSQTRYTDWLQLPLLFVLIVVLLGSEWVIRKYNGEI